MGILNAVADKGDLSSSQLKKLQDSRRYYLYDKPNVNDKEKIRRNIGAVSIEVYQAYLEQIRRRYTPMDMSLDVLNDDNRTRYFDITKWVTDPQEKSLDKLANVYQSLSGEECNIALIYHRTKSRCGVTLAVSNTSKKYQDPETADEYYYRMVGAIRGNFPGAEIVGMGNAKNEAFGIGMPSCLEQLSGKTESVTIVSNLASEKSENFISQSMEKLIDGMVPENEEQDYTIVLLAEPVNNQLQRMNRLFDIYTYLSPYSGWQAGFTSNESTGLMSNASINMNASVGMSAHIVPEVLDINANFGMGFARMSGENVQVGSSENITQSYINFGVKHTLQVIEEQLKRLEESSALGTWNFAAYFISEDPVIANNTAHMYLSLTQGEKSYMTGAAVNSWNGIGSEEQTRIIIKSIQKLRHPVFRLNIKDVDNTDSDWLMYPTSVTPAAVLSGKELARALNFPERSVSGLPVFTVIPFGREPHSLTEGKLDLKLGSGYHMRRRIPEQEIFLSKEELTKHTFITGSTGSGKSNTIYCMLKRLAKENVKFLVVEPAKGEYKTDIGREMDIAVYGTNPNMTDTKLLRVNPFSFPEHTHILEHLDRLVEIFNVCWQMYAAMPAILKDSVERAYISCGWDLESSVNKYAPDIIYPTFGDIVREIRQVLAESDYSGDNKGDYTGALVTRLRSLTNGINGLIFTPDAIDDNVLFDENAIVDLSRIGSSETKSLIMGILVLKLQEHRMEQRCNGQNSNDSLKHTTVLEEAHNLLKRTSSEQVTEGANMIGKSVEMLANSIAEMRTYGEGFIIADQSPGLLDMSVIRNTNTKIILRLPDISDRELVGKAAGLTDEQIIELTKLEQGVAAVSQSDWLEPVLCKIDKFEKSSKLRAPTPKSEHSVKAGASKVSDALVQCIMNKELYRKGDRIDIKKLKSAVLRSGLDGIVKRDYLEYINAKGNDDMTKTLKTLVYDFFHAEESIKKSEKCDDITVWMRSVANNLEPPVAQYPADHINRLVAVLADEQRIRDAAYGDIVRRLAEFIREGAIY